DGEDLDVDVLAKDLILHAFLRNAEQAGERVGRQRRLPPLDDVALVVVVGALDKEQQKSSALGDIRHVSLPRHDSLPESGPKAATLATRTVTSPRWNSQTRVPPPSPGHSPTRGNPAKQVCRKVDAGFRS